MLLPAAPTTPRNNNNNNNNNPFSISSVCTPSASTSSRYGSRDLFQSEKDFDNENNNNISYPQQQINSFEFKEDNNNNNKVESAAIFTISSDYCNIIPKRRPPLNRAIPPIPESKSNESIISAQSNSLGQNRRLSSFNQNHLIQNNNKNLKGNSKNTRKG